MRLFVAIDLNAELKAALADLQGQLRRAWPGADVRWVDPSGIHLTLKFLGEVGANKVDAVVRALAEAVAGVEPFELKLEGLGCFPSERRARVVWVGVKEPTGRLARLQRQVEVSLEGLGFAPEGREFVPHITLGRLRIPANFPPVNEGLARQQVGRMRVREVVLMESRLSPTGATYRAVSAFSLGRLPTQAPGGPPE